MTPPVPAATWRRCAAFVVDSILLGVLLSLVGGVAALLLGPAVRLVVDGTASARLVVDPRALMLSDVGAILVGCGYFVVAWTHRAATPGQWLFALRVESVDGGRLPPGRAFTRWVALGAPLWIAASTWPGAGGLIAWVAAMGWFATLLIGAARDAEGRGLHDRVSGSRVRAAGVPVVMQEVVDVR